MKRSLVTSACIMALGACHVANAFPTITATVGGSAAPNAYYVNFDDETAGPLGLTVTPNAQIVTGSAGGLYAAPYVSGDNNDFFNSIQAVPGLDTTKYLTSGRAVNPNADAKIILSFATVQNYLGLLWGSVDWYNTLSFYASTDGTGTPVQTITGQTILNANSAIAAGNQGINGTAYVNIDGLAGFQSAVFTSSQYAFEFDNVAYKTSVPDGGSLLSIFGLVFLGMASYARCRR